MMERLSAYVGSLHTRWLASSVACCFPTLQDQHDLEPSTVNKQSEICYQQPQPIPAPFFDFDHVRPASRASRASQFIADSRNLASRASRRASSATRSTSRRPTIGAPSDFRRVDLPRGRTPNFRPLQLSIYLPGNELPCLPTFQEAEEEDNAGLVYPAQALVKSRSDSMLSRPSASFTIPRKPVPSRTVSLDQTRCSMESRFTFNDLSSIADSRAVHRRPSLAARQSTQDFLDSLDARLPQSPPALQHKPGPEPVYTLYRRASEQSLRLRTHLEERSRIESLLPECDTILEEKYADVGGKSKGLSPILDRDESTPVEDLLGDTKADYTRSISSPSLVSSRYSHRASLHRETIGSAKPFRRSLVSQWLLRSVGSQASLGSQAPLTHTTADDCTGHQPCTFRDRSSTASSTIYSSSTAADLQTTCTSPYSSPHKKIDSVSTYHTLPPPRMSYDWEAKPFVVEAKPVGVAV